MKHRNFLGVPPPNMPDIGPIVGPPTENNKRSEEIRACPQVITWARSPSGEERAFPNPCAVPSGWKTFIPDNTIVQIPQTPAPKPAPSPAPAPTPTPTLGDYLMGLATGSGEPKTSAPSVIISPEQQNRFSLLPIVGAVAVAGLAWYYTKGEKAK